MTLTELRYIVAVAKQKHFGKAAEVCFVSQPTLSVAVKKLEDELGVQLFERGANEITITDLGFSIIRQAEYVLEQAQQIKQLAQQNKNPLKGHLRMGIIYTIAPYLLPSLIKNMIKELPQMPLILEESFTVRLLELLRQGEIDCAILAEPFNDHGLVIEPLYTESFVVAVPKGHIWEQRDVIHADELKNETMLLLGNGHCFRDHVLEVCPELSRLSQTRKGIQKTFEGSSLETIRHMVASGLGITVLPRTAINELSDTDDFLSYIPFAAPAPFRKIVLVYRKTFSRIMAMNYLKDLISRLNLSGALIN